jgi:hypothetical protein
VICPACNSAPTPSFHFPGDTLQHPHSAENGELRIEEVDR